MKPYVIPYTIAVDTAETQPYTFEDLKADANKQYRPLVIQCKWQCLGRHPHSLGDYSIVGMEGRVHVERKSVEDAQGTVLGWSPKSDREEERPGRRDRFEKELENLEKVECAIVVVEGNIDHIMEVMPSWGEKSSELNAKIWFRSVLAYMQDYRVNWLFCNGRRLAEISTFRFLDRFWRKHQP